MNKTIKKFEDRVESFTDCLTHCEAVMCLLNKAYEQGRKEQEEYYEKEVEIADKRWKAAECKLDRLFEDYPEIWKTL